MVTTATRSGETAAAVAAVVFNLWGVAPIIRRQDGRGRWLVVAELPTLPGEAGDSFLLDAVAELVQHNEIGDISRAMVAAELASMRAEMEAAQEWVPPVDRRPLYGTDEHDQRGAIAFEREQAIMLQTLRASDVR